MNYIDCDCSGTNPTDHSAAVEVDLLKGIHVAKNIMLSSFLSKCSGNVAHQSGHVPPTSSSRLGADAGAEPSVYAHGGLPHIPPTALPQLWQALVRKSTEVVGFDEVRSVASSLVLKTSCQMVM